MDTQESTVDRTWQSRVHQHVKSAKRPLIVILGPTASGKTEFSIKVAKEIGNVEIVNADSRQLYRGMDIGTAKITPGEMQNIPHHLLNVLDPDEEVTIAWYKEQATRVINDIHARGNVPVLVGGSMLYISAIIDGLQPIETTDPALRKKLTDEYEKDEGESLYARLREMDPDAASSIHQNNKPYVIRAMEIFEAKGQKASSLKSYDSVPYELLLLGIDLPRDRLLARINERTAELFRRGWMREVGLLRGKGYGTKDPGMKSHGYREILRAIRDEQINEQDLVEKISAKTRQYAKRQMTWWRNDPRIHWLTPA